MPFVKFQVAFYNFDLSSMLVTKIHDLSSKTAKHSKIDL